jgi:hypothetical protein
MDLEHYDRPKDGIKFFETCISVIAAAIVTGVAIGAAYLAGRLPIDLDGAVTTAQHVAEATTRKEMHPCDFTAIQYGHYHEKRKSAPECYSGTRELPPHILTMPVRQE